MSQRPNNRLSTFTESAAGSSFAHGAGGGTFLPPARPPGVLPTLAISLLLVLAVFAVFGQTLKFDFVNYDDDLYVYENPNITSGLDLDKIVWLFTHNYGVDEWYPLTDSSHILDWEIYGSGAGGHHLTNVLLHAATVVILFLTLRRMTGALWRSALVAAVFAIHPLRVESVAWVTERKDVLSGFFFMLTLWMWARYMQARSMTEDGEGTQGNFLWVFNPLRWPRDYSLALVFFILALLSKSMVVTAPFILLLLDYWPLNRAPSTGPVSLRARAWFGLVLEKAPFLILGAVACAVTFLTQKDPVTATQGLTIPWRIGNALLAYGVYLGHLVFPVGLHLLYPHPENILPVGELVLSTLALLIITAGVLVGRRRHPWLLVGWLWYLGMFVPVIDIMQTGDQTHADRYTYLPQIGLAVMFAWGTAALSGSWPHRRVLQGCGAGVILTVLLTAACVQTMYWKNSISLWNRTLAGAPQSYIAHCNLGIALAARGRSDEAIHQFDQALQINPQDGKSLNNLGKVFTARGQWTEGIHYFEQALQLNPRDVKALNNRGVARAAQGKLADAVQDYEQALDLAPDFIDAEYNLGRARVDQGRLEEAIQCYQQTLRLNPDFIAAQCAWGLVLARQGKWDDAAQHYQQALAVKPDDAEALNDLGSALVAQGKLEEAGQYYQQTLQSNPDNVDALNNWGVLLARQGKREEAMQEFQQALKIKPDDASTHNNLAITLAEEGHLNEAAPHFQQALNLAVAQNNAALAQSIRARLKTLSEN